MNGWIDLQVNGWGGIDFSDPALTEEQALTACQSIRTSGTSGFLATLITCDETVYQRNFSLMAKVKADGLLGLHVEGPFFNPECGALGVHSAAACLPADVDRLQEWQERAGGNIRLLTIGADLPHAPELTAAACRLGITVSLGHHLATFDQIRACADAGATALTHFGNGLPLTIHRHHNPLWAGLAEERLAVMVIADGHHVPQPMLQVVARVAGERLILVSDAASIAGTPPGSYRCFGREVELHSDGRLVDIASGGFAGSAASLSDCVAVARSWDIPNVEAAASQRPLNLIGVAPPPV
jgi:N-acetylglucosamine-6-phosphate deacetylase